MLLAVPKEEEEAEEALAGEEHLEEEPRLATHVVALAISQGTVFKDLNATTAPVL